MNNDHADTSHWLSLAQAAESLGTTTLNVLMHIKRGVLSGVEIDGAWLVDPASLKKLLKKRREGEVPAVCRSGCSKAHGCKSCG